MDKKEIHQQIDRLNEEIELLKGSRATQNRRTPIGQRNIEHITKGIQRRMDEIKRLEASLEAIAHE